jgi:nucleoside-diphosphate-sugar epimerase
MKKILVTGGSGFIGSSITRFLVESGYTVRVLDNNSRGRISRLSDIEKEFEFRVGDIRDENLVYKSLLDIDSVVHLAYINGTASFYSQPEEVLDVGIRGMQNIINGIKNSSVSELYLASSSEVYQKPSVFPTPESVPLVVPDVFNPRYSYGLGKIVQEFMAIHSTPSLSKKVIFRPHNVYGPDMGTLHVVPELFLKIADTSSDTVTLKGDGTQQRSMCEIQDFIHGFSLLLSNAEVPQIVNIGTRFEMTILELASEIASQLRVEKNFLSGLTPSGETDRRLPDISKLEKLGYKPSVSIHEGIAKYCAWFNQSNQSS